MLFRNYYKEETNTYPFSISHPYFKTLSDSFIKMQKLAKKKILLQVLLSNQRLKSMIQGPCVLIIWSHFRKGFDFSLYWLWLGLLPHVPLLQWPGFPAGTPGWDSDHWAPVSGRMNSSTLGQASASLGLNPGSRPTVWTHMPPCLPNSIQDASRTHLASPQTWSPTKSVSKPTMDSHFLLQISPSAYLEHVLFKALVKMS